MYLRRQGEHLAHPDADEQIALTIITGTGLEVALDLFEFNRRAEVAELPNECLRRALRAVDPPVTSRTPDRSDADPFRASTAGRSVDKVVERTGFRLLWSSTAASNLADGMALVVLPLLALDGGTDAAGVAVITVALTLAWPVVGLHAGWLVDRLPKRVVLVTGNLARGAAFGGLGLWATLGTVPLWAILLAAAIYGLGEILVDTALNASVPAVVEPARRTAANSAIEAAITVTNELVGRPLAGILIGLGFTVALGALFALYAGAALLAVAIVALSRRTVDESAPDPAAKLRLRDGLVTLWRHPVLRSLTVLTSLTNLAWAMFYALFVVYAVRPGPLGLDPTTYGLVLSLAALGGIGSSLLAPMLIRRVPTRLLLFTDMAGTVMLVLPVALGAPLWVVVAGIILASSGSTLWRVIVSSYRQQEIEEHLLGRAYAAYRVIGVGSLPIGAGIAAVMAAIADVTTVFWVATIIAAATAMLFLVLARRPIRLET